MRALLALLLISPALAATHATVTPRTWDLYRSTSKVSSHASLQACVDAAKALNVARSYTCRHIADVVVTITPDCPPQPAAETRTQQCVAPLVGSWLQSRAYVSAPAPTCWTAGPWTPADPPAGACTAPPTVTASVSPATIAPNGSTALTYSGPAGASCALMVGSTQVGVLPGSPVTLGPIAATVTFTVQCGSVESAPVMITVQAAPPVTQDLSWAQPTQRQDGSAISGSVQYVVRRDGQIITTTTARTLAAQPPGCYTIATVEGGVEGPPTNPLCFN